MFENLKLNLQLLGIALAIAIVLLIIFVVRRTKKAQTPQPQKASTAAKGTGLKKGLATGATVLGGGGIAYYLISSPIGPYILVGALIILTVIIFVVLKAISNVGTLGPLSNKQPTGRKRLTKRERSLRRLRNKYNRWKKLGWKMEMGPSGGYFRRHKDDKTVITLVDPDTGEIVSYDPMEQFDYSETSTTGLMGGFDVSDLEVEVLKDGSKIWRTPDGTIVATTPPPEFERFLEDIREEGLQKPKFGTRTYIRDMDK